MAKSKSLSEWGRFAIKLGALRAKAVRGWCVQRRKRMERELEKLGLPRDSWRELTLAPLSLQDLNNPLGARILLDPFAAKAAGKLPILTESVRKAPQGTQIERVLWAATIARLADTAGEASNPDVRLMLGVLLERYQAWFERPDEHSAAAAKQTVRNARSKGGRGRAAKKPARTRERDEAMKQRFIVAVTHDGMSGAEAVRDVAGQYHLSLPQTRRIIKPRKLMKNLRRS